MRMQAKHSNVFSFYHDALCSLFLRKEMRMQSKHSNVSSFDHEMHIFSIVHFEQEMRTRAKHSNFPSFHRS